MRIINNGVAKEFTVLKHFKLGREEYVLYKNESGVAIGQIDQGKILAPRPEKIELLMKMLSNLLSSNPIESINIANGCVVLSEIIETPLEEVGFQVVNIPEATINSLINNLNNAQTVVNQTPQTVVQPNQTVQQTAPPQEEPKKEKTSDNRMKIYGIIIVVLALVLGLLLFKDKIFKSGGGSSSPTPSPTVETPTPQPTDNTITALNIYDLTSEEQEISLGSTSVKIKADNNKIIVNGEEVVDYADAAKAYVTNKFIILVSVSQIDGYVKAINENGQVIDITGIQTSPSEPISNLQVENGKLVAERFNELDPNAASQKVEFAYDGNQITITEIA